MKRQTIYLAAICATFVWVGTTITLPTTARADTTPANQPTSGVSSISSQVAQLQPQITYTVKQGDYLQTIADSFHLSWPSIFQANQSIQDPDVIYPGQQLDIPDQDIPLTRSLPPTTMTIPDTYHPAVEQNTAAITVAAHSQATFLPSGGPILSYALAMVGRPYVYGGTTPAGFDCSGLTQYLAAERGISLPRTVMQQYAATSRESLAQIQPGDLIFFNANHVGMYIGNGQVIHAANPSLGVRVDTVQSAIQYNGYLGAGALGH